MLRNAKTLRTPSASGGKILLVLPPKSNYNGAMKKIYGKILILASAIAIIDQLTKQFALKNFQNQNFEITSFFRLTYGENTGIAFGIPVPPLLLIFITIALIAFVFYLVKSELKIKSSLTQIITVMIVGGGLGNLIDRIVQGYVIDFISLWSYPVFNVADIAITLGVLLAILFYGKIKRA